MTDPTLAKLRELLLNRCEAELAGLCQDIGLNYDALPGTGAFGKTREIVESARSNDRLRALQSRLRELRPEAYEAADLSLPIASVATSTVAPTQPVAQTATKDTGLRSLQMLALGLVVVLCAVVGLAVLLPRLNEVTGAPERQTTAADATQPAPPGAPATAPADSGPAAPGEVLVPATTEVPAVVVPAVEPVPAGGQGSPGSSANVTETLATPGAIIGAPQVTTPESAEPVTTTVAGESPAIQTIRGLNAQLPAFYRGQASTKDLEEHWTGEALRSVTGFGNQRLPRAMRIQPSQRDSLNVSYEYLSPPTLTSNSGNGAVVTSLVWRYANALNATQICETRDYTYNLVNEGGQFRVREFRSRLLNSGCQAQ